MLLCRLQIVGVGVPITMLWEKIEKIQCYQAVTLYMP